VARQIDLNSTAATSDFRNTLCDFGSVQESGPKSSHFLAQLAPLAFRIKLGRFIAFSTRSEMLFVKT
jgi:hypothetical protein